MCEREGVGAAVLLRALEPTTGVERMREAARRPREATLLCAGPGRLTEALAITAAHDGLSLDAPPFSLTAADALVEIASTPRVGITRAGERPWRYVVAGSRFLSRPRLRAAPSGQV